MVGSYASVSVRPSVRLSHLKIHITESTLSEKFTSANGYGIIAVTGMASCSCIPVQAGLATNRIH